MDPDVLGQLLHRHADTLVLYARQWCDGPEDVVQDAFVKLAAQRTPPDDLVAWLFRVVRNGAINAGVAARRRRRHETGAALRDPRLVRSRTVGGSRPRHRSRDRRRRALEGLPIAVREVIGAALGWADVRAGRRPGRLLDEHRAPAVRERFIDLVETPGGTMSPQQQVPLDPEREHEREREPERCLTEVEARRSGPWCRREPARPDRDRLMFCAGQALPARADRTLGLAHRRGHPGRRRSRRGRRPGDAAVDPGGRRSWRSWGQPWRSWG